MKRLLIVLLMMTLMLGLAACGGESTTPASETPQEQVPAAETSESPGNEPADYVPAEEPPQEQAAPPSGPMHDPNKVYFHDTYSQLAGNPSIMWGDFFWDGWFDVMSPLTHEEGKWYSFEIMNGALEDNYKMLIFFNGLQDDDPDSIQWVWNYNDGYPKGNYFIADFVNSVNPPSPHFKGEQRDASSFATLEQAEAAIGNVIH
ncbi:MAG: hypothetical protein FWE74_06325 [Oscillospiraceae bacterium]|nr:hypothetical protein [Oscillospiraceae bacterium]